MTQRLNIRIKSLVAMLLLLSGVLLCGPSSRAEISLYSSTGIQFSLAFRPSAATATNPVFSVQPPEIEEVSTSFLYAVAYSLQRQQASLSQWSPQPGSLPVLIGDMIARDADYDLQALPLGTAAWNFPEGCIELVSGERPAPRPLAHRSLVLTADYAATAFGGTCTAWDLTSSMGHGEGGVGASSEDHEVLVRIGISIPAASIVAYRDTTLRATAPQPEKAEQFTASAQDSQVPQFDLSEPIRQGDAARPWTLPPRLAEEFRGRGFQLISTENATKSQSATPAVRRPSLRAGGAGFGVP